MAAVADYAASLSESPLATEFNCFTLSKLNELAGKSPTEVLQFVTKNRSEFLSLLRENNTQQDLMSFAITVLDLACTAEANLRQDLYDFMITMSSIIDPISVNFQRWLVSCYKSKKLEKCHLDALLHLTVFLKTFQSTLPSSSSDFVSILLPLLTQTCEKCLKDDEELHRIVSKQLNEIKVEQTRFFEHHTAVEIKRESEKEKLHLLEPPENFRTLSILPTADDIELPCSFLRPNIVKGRYKDTEHYLDVQFRLLREDYIKPLRDGIAEYLSIKKKKQNFKNCKSVRVYNNVSIESEQFVDGELMHVLIFRDANFSEIKWENSSRLIRGNLLCLSADDFKTILFATVQKRDVKELKKGLLTVMFEEMSNKVFHWKSTVNFVVIEMPGLFESYRHNLSVLQQLDTKTFSMKKYIVDLQKTINRPQYLQSSVTYDMTPLLTPLNEKYRNKNIPIDAIRACKAVTVAEDDHWPTASMLNLDESQYLALKSAVTKEFSIIQGPPGTGKTYIGLRAVQLLLYNIRTWFRVNSGSLPILIVCYTNHALDQFLEGILTFTEKIARIGGRTSSEIIAGYQINNLKKKNKLRWLGPSLYDKLKEANSNVFELKNRINTIDDYIEGSKEDVLSEHILQKNIPLDQYKSLKGFKKNVEHWEKIFIYDWLKTRASNESPSEKRSKTNETRNDSLLKINMEIESEGEADIEFIESQRNVDFYNFDDTRVFKKASFLDENSAESSNQEWNVQRKPKRNEIKYIRESLQNNPAMASHRALKIKNVWNLSIPERWQLYKFWLGSFIQEKRLEYVDLQQKLSIALKQRADVRVEEDLYVLKDIHVVGMTTTGAAKYRHIIDAMNPVVVIVEEAAEILESHIITSLAPKTQHVILIGDQQQLRPSPTVYMLAFKYGMNISLFERMIKNGMDYCRLSVQHRMRPEIASLIVPHIYTHLKNHEAVAKIEHVKGLCKDVFFVTHDFNELLVQDSKSKVNDHEARFIVRLCAYLLQQGYQPSQITVLTTYTGQLLTMKRLAIEQGLITRETLEESPDDKTKSDPFTKASKNVRFTVVDNFQGEENDIILISFVRSNNDGEVGFLKVSNRICVALSRARKGLYCIGNFELLAQKSKLWNKITQTLVEMKSIGQSLCLTCQNHPDVFNEIRHDADFATAPDGGCSRKCEYRMSCGHSCILFCHPYDKYHENILCKKSCQKFCKNEHQCSKKCFEDCGPCGTLIDRTLTLCGHTVNAACGKEESEIMCFNPCGKSCKNGHPCPKICCECTDFCETVIDRELSRCGHTVRAPCGADQKDINCTNPCKKACSRGHPCTKKCFEPCFCEILVDKTCLKCDLIWKVPCHNLSYAKCANSCNKSCNNGHLCQKKCFEVCYCDVMIEKTLKACGHSVTAPCGAPESQINCRKKIQIPLPTCGHSVEDSCFMRPKYTSMFYKSCLYKKCTKPCEKLLPCGHNCKGLCRECKQGKVHIKCKESCKKLLPCGHGCVKKCSEPCVVKCRQMTNILSPVCDHFVEAECFIGSDQNELSKRCCEPCKEILPCDHMCKGTCGGCKQRLAHVKCMEACKKTLNCGHECVKKCSEPCIVKCMQMTQIQSPVCDHLLSIACCFTSKLNKLSERCLEPCKEVLPCGHACKGSCSSCYQGRLHVACQENCERILICGHKCESKCSISCPPCEKPCENWCCHRKCPRTCGSPCVKCNQFCEWHCKHMNCNRRCNEICDRESCNEPCMKKLPCSHTCIGFCGEPCPKQCLVCDSEGLQEACRDPKSDNYPGYVYLEDCNHVFKEDDLNKWLTASSNNTHEIRLKTCPKCTSIIRKNVRFGKIVKICLAEVEKVKYVAKSNKTVCLHIQTSLLQVINESQILNVLYKPIVHELSSRYPRNIRILTNLESIIKIAGEIESKSYDTYSTIKSPLVKSLLEFYCSCKERLRCFILNNFLTVSEFQLLQLSREAYRMSLLDFILKFACQNNFTSIPPEFEECAFYLTTYKPFTDDSVKCFETAFQKFVENSQKDNENMPPKYHPILKVINMSGYWYQCSKKHIHCISRVTEAVHDVCYECDEKSDEQQLIGRSLTTGFKNYSSSWSNDGEYISKLSESSRWNKKNSKSSDAAWRGKKLSHEADSIYRSLPSCSTAASDNSKHSVPFYDNSYSSKEPVPLPHHIRSEKLNAKRSSGLKRFGEGEQGNKFYRNTSEKHYSNERIAPGPGSETTSECRGSYRPKTRSRNSRSQFDVTKQTNCGKIFQEHSQERDGENKEEMLTKRIVHSAAAPRPAFGRGRSRRPSNRMLSSNAKFSNRIPGRNPTFENRPDSDWWR